ncbi:MAG: amidohydrolase family protein [Alphaproteobacteria bacterium]|nr:amidohydrolase family protein [Alphaproteobacteria bacterium]
MPNTLFTNVRIIDGTGAQPYAGEVLIQGNRISRIGRGVRSLQAAGVNVIDAAGATLMPGMCEAHTHFGWTNSKTLDAIQKLPHEEHTLWAAQVAKQYLDYGWTSCVGAATPKPRLDCVIRNAINSGQIPGPRYLAASQEITVTGSLGDDMLPHLPYKDMSFGCVIDGPEDMRRTVRMFLKYGVDQIKLNLSGDNLVPGADARTNWMSDEEVEIAAREVKVRGKRLASHARSSGSVKQSLRHGVEVIYHASFADEECLDMLEAQKGKVFVAPGLSVIIRLLNEGAVVGVDNQAARKMGYDVELEAAVNSMKAMLKRGIRVLPGGDYGFAWAPHGENAKDLVYFVKHLGMTPMEAIVSCTKWGGEIMMMGSELGLIKEGYLADLLLVDGDPISNIEILQDRNKLLAIMKDGQFHKTPELRSVRTRWSQPAA